jgi:malonyl-CoA O-methyltransferase
MKNFDIAADTYDSFGIIQKWAAKQLGNFVSSTIDNRRGNAIEFGAGTGLFTQYMLPWDENYLATDQSIQMVNLGKKKFPQVKWQVMDCRYPILLRPGGYDYIFCCSVLHWLDDPISVLKEWKKLLPHHAEVFIGLFIKGTLAELNDLAPEATPLPWQDKKHWMDCFCRAGFMIANNDSVEKKISYPDTLSLFRSLHKTGVAPCRLLSPGKLRRIIDHYDMNAVEIGCIYANWKILLVHLVVTTK